MYAFINLTFFSPIVEILWSSTCTVAMTYLWNNLICFLKTLSLFLRYVSSSSSFVWSHLIHMLCLNSLYYVLFYHHHCHFCYLVSINLLINCPQRISKNLSLGFKGALPYGIFLISNLTPNLDSGFSKTWFSK